MEAAVSTPATAISGVLPTRRVLNVARLASTLWSAAWALSLIVLFVGRLQSCCRIGLTDTLLSTVILAYSIGIVLTLKGRLLPAGILSSAMLAGHSYIYLANPLVACPFCTALLICNALLCAAMILAIVLDGPARRALLVAPAILGALFVVRVLESQDALYRLKINSVQLETNTDAPGNELRIFTIYGCGSCNRALIGLPALKAQLPPGYNVRVIDVATKKGYRVARELKVKDYPTVVLFKYGKEITRNAGPEALGKTFALVNSQ